MDHLQETRKSISAKPPRRIYMVWNIPAGPTPVSQAGRAPTLGVWATDSPLKVRDLHLAFGLGAGGDKSPVTDDEDSVRATAGQGGASGVGATGACPDVEA